MNFIIVDATMKARQARKLTFRWVREIGTASLQLCEGMLRENIDVTVNI